MELNGNNLMQDSIKESFVNSMGVEIEKDEANPYDLRDNFQPVVSKTASMSAI